MSLRTRLLLTTSAIVFVVVSTLSLGIYFTTARHLLGETDNTLDARVVAIADSLRSNQELPNDGRRMRNPLGEALLPTRFDTVTQVISPDGTVRIALGEVDLPITQAVLSIANNPDDGIARSTIDIEGVSYRMLVVPLTRGGALQLAINISDIEDAKQGIRTWMFGLGAAGIFVAGIAGWWVARRTAKPIQQLANAAEQIALTRQLDHTLDIHGDREVEQLATSFNTMLAALRQSGEQQRQLVQDASHELRTPLTSLRANAELLERDSLDAETKQSILRDIRTEVDELASLSAELTALASDQRLTEEIQPVSLRDAAHDIAQRASRRSGRTVNVVAVTDSTIHVRPSQLERAISNLVDNALKFCPTPQPVEITIVGKTIAVVDHGPGISDADKPLVFDRFYRATATRALPGSGLGLAIVKQFANDHDATIAITDTVGGGATVSITFA
jgi:two-component system sensor histidine kinase MprB